MYVTQKNNDLQLKCNSRVGQQMNTIWADSGTLNTCTI